MHGFPAASSASEVSHPTLSAASAVSVCQPMPSCQAYFRTKKWW